MDGYHMMDEDGRKSGYGYDFLRLMARYWDVEYEYIGYDKGWSDMQQMLENGEIDIGTATRKTPEREEKFDFSRPIGSNECMLTVRSDNTSVIEQVYTTYDGLRVGFLNGNMCNDDFDTLSKEKGFTYTPVYFDLVVDMEKALRDGQVDALVSNSMRDARNERVVEKFAPEPIYAIVKKGNTALLAKINAAIDEMNAAEGDWKTTLFNRYYTSVNDKNPELTEDEKTLVRWYNAQSEPLRVLCDPTREPYSFMENGEIKGILPDYFKELAKYAGLSYQFIPCRTREEYLAFTDMTTVAERLKGHTSLALTSQTVDRKWILTLITPQRKDADGNVTAVLVATRDATEEKRREQKQEDALRDALAAAEHANKAKTVFLNSMSHDIRTPMNAIIGFTALATAHIDNIDLVKEYLKKISVSGQHLLSLINDILDMSRIESGTVKLDNTEVHLPDVLHDLRTIIQGNISAKQLDLYIDTQDVHHEDIITDKLRLNQVLLNIVGNAVKFTPAGGTINIRVEEKPSARSGYATFVFSVKDNGIGMSKDFQAHVFDSFSREQTATRSGIQGTGLGMAISKNIVDMMGGTIVVKSEQGKGSEFTVTLDCKVCTESVKYPPIPGLKGTRALVVDDDAQTCMSVSKMLREIEMEADWTTSGKEAILRAREAHNQGAEFKVYIIDWLMPDMNGIETVRRIRKVIEPGTPIIILTAYDWADIEDEARQAGVTAFVSKPLFMSELRDALTHKVVSGRQPLLPKHGDYTGKKVLLVEDNELNREIATAILEEAGLKVDAVEDGTDAVARMNEAAEDEYDLILMDIQMPKMDGYTATREIRTLSSNKKANIPIVAMTANAFEEDRQKAFKAGMNAHIAKPIDVNILMGTLDKVFKQNS